MEKLHWAIRLRRLLLFKGSWKWNAWVRDVTGGKLEPKSKDKFDKSEYTYNPISGIITPKHIIKIDIDKKS